MNRVCVELVVVLSILGGAQIARAAEEVDSDAGRLDRLTVLGDDWPRALFFRAAEVYAARRSRLGMSYDEWLATFDRLTGIEGKVLEEEVPGRSVNQEFFARFKTDRPDQIVLLHFNGISRDPRFERDAFFPGHWLYLPSVEITTDVQPETGEGVIAVADASLFSMTTGLGGRKADDIVLVAHDAAGQAEWYHSEQVQLLGIDKAANTIRVRRGAYGTRPKAFVAGKTRAAAHASGGPWGKNSNLLWRYNLSTVCPLDRNGHSCGDVLAADLSKRFAPGGELADFDGIQFDVSRGQLWNVPRGLAIDCDGDGVGDNGVFDGVNTYGCGVVAFYRKLRAGLGDDRLILADGHAAIHQRGFSVLNGIESEGWPDMTDWAIRDWSGGLNRLFYWRRFAQRPVFNYINHKYIDRSGGHRRRPDIPWGRHRLVFAVALSTDSAICWSYPAVEEPDGTYGIWDELWMGTEHRVGWLGSPVGEARRLATEQPDLLAGSGVPAGASLLKRLRAPGVHLEVDPAGIRVAARQSTAAQLALRIADVPCPSDHLVVVVNASAEPSRAEDSAAPRILRARADPHATWDADTLQPVTTRKLFEEPMTWVGPEPFSSVFAFEDIQPVEGRVNIDLRIEGSEPLLIHSVTVHAAPDAMLRLYEHGLVLANPSSRDVTFDLPTLFPGERFRRLAASPGQDTRTNDGSRVDSPIILSPREGLFLIREH